MRGRLFDFLVGTSRAPSPLEEKLKQIEARQEQIEVKQKQIQEAYKSLQNPSAPTDGSYLFPRFAALNVSVFGNAIAPEIAFSHSASVLFSMSNSSPARRSLEARWYPSAFRRVEGSIAESTFVSLRGSSENLGIGLGYKERDHSFRAGGYSSCVIGGLSLNPRTYTVKPFFAITIF